MPPGSAVTFAVVGVFSALAVHAETSVRTAPSCALTALSSACCAATTACCACVMPPELEPDDEPDGPDEPEVGRVGALLDDPLGVAAVGVRAT